jgi:hypothetical protein
MNIRAWLAGLLVVAGAAQAQINNMDFGVASEVVRNLMNERTAMEIQQSTNLLTNYREVALQQELAQEAVRRGLTERVDVQRTLEQYRRNVLVQALRQDVERRTKAPTEAEVAAIFKQQSTNLIMRPAYQMDAWLVVPSDTQSLAMAKSFAIKKPVADETVAKITAPRLVKADQDVWLTSGQMSSNVWHGLMGMQLGEVQLFPDTSNTMVVRRGAFRAERPLSIEEARPALTAELTARAAAATWQAHLEQLAKELGLNK